MKYLIPLAVATLAFGVGRWSVGSPESIPGIPIAFAQMTQDIAVTIDVDLDPDSKQPVEGGLELYELKGTATYRFTNFSDAPVSLTFPPTQTRAIGGNFVSHQPTECRSYLQKPQTIEIAPRQCAEFCGEWNNTVSGDLDEMLVSGAGWECFTFRPPQDPDPSINHFSGTVIAFQAFSDQDNPSDLHTTEGHLRFVSRARHSKK